MNKELRDLIWLYEGYCCDSRHPLIMPQCPPNPSPEQYNQYVEQLAEFNSLDQSQEARAKRNKEIQTKIVNCEEQITKALLDHFKFKDERKGELIISHCLSWDNDYDIIDYSDTFNHLEDLISLLSELEVKI